MIISVSHIEWSVQRSCCSVSFAQNGWTFVHIHQRQTIPAGNPFEMPQTLVFRNVSQWEHMQGQKLCSSWFQMYSEAAQKVASTYLTFPKASLRVGWLCPISASCWEHITNDSCSLVFFLTCVIIPNATKMPFSCSLKSSIPFQFTVCSVCVCAFWLWQHIITNWLCDNNSLTRAWTLFPSTIKCTTFILHPVESPGVLTVKPFPGSRWRHMHVQV